MTVAVRQTMAMFLDAYRELAAGKLFWITLALSALVAGAFAAVGIDEDGLSVFWIDLPFPITSSDITPASLYKLLFFQFGLGVWLTWIATVLALVTTASIIPSLVSSGVIDSMIAKPISRTRLFLTRYATGLLFALLQVTLFSLSAFLVIGVRGGEWIWSSFLAVPIVLVFFSYLSAIMAFFGLLTRSTISSLLLTLLVWFMLFIVNVVDNEIIEAHEAAKIRVESQERNLDTALENARLSYIQQQERQGNELPEDYRPTRDEVLTVNVFIPTLERAIERNRESVQDLEPWSRGMFIAKSILPKTGETIGLLDRFVMSEEDATAFLGFIPEDMAETEVDDETGAVRVGIRDSATAVAEVYESRSLVWVVGTSLVFEGFILGICGIIFARRDF
ncbi:MAG: hypothetical protein AAGB48_08880 [Planctomycetota bacterium]